MKVFYVVLFAITLLLPALQAEGYGDNKRLIMEATAHLDLIAPEDRAAAEKALAVSLYAEAYGATDALLTIYDSPFGPYLVPMFHHVYSGRKITFGRLESKDPNGFAQQFAQCFIWGSQMGWDGLWSNSDMGPGTPGGEYLKELARVYTAEARCVLDEGRLDLPAQCPGLSDDAGGLGGES